MTTTAAPPEAALAYRTILSTHRDTMIAWLVSEYQMPIVRATIMVDQYFDVAAASVVKDNREHELWDAAVAGLVTWETDDPDTALAELIVDEALGFLPVAADNPGYGPSLLVDWGWHALQTWSMPYEALGLAAFGRRLHHEPSGFLVFPADYSEPTFTLDDTVAAMRARGPVRDLLWITSGKCGNPCDGCCSMRCRQISPMAAGPHAA